MAIEIQPESVQEPGGREPSGLPKARPWWMRPAIHTALLGAVIGYAVGHWLGNFVASGYQQIAPPTTTTSPSSSATPSARSAGWSGSGVFNDVVRQMLGRPVTGDRGSRAWPGQVLQVLARPQGGRPPVPVRDDRLLPDRRPVRDGDQGRAAVTHVPPAHPQRLPRGGRRARHHDDDDDDLGRHGPARQLPDAADDRLQADGVPADRGAVVLADPGGVRRPAVQRADRRVPDRLDRLRAAVHPGPRGHGRLRRRLRASWASRSSWPRSTSSSP